VVKQLLLFLFLFLSVNDIYSQSDLTLPVYKINIKPSDLSKLYADPSSNDYYPATIIKNDTTYDCQIRFRGASTRSLPKKNWKIKFSDNENFFNSDKINFNAEYRDRSQIRNFLTTKLFEFNSQPAPKIEFINVFVNNDYQGVYSQVEELEEDFLKRNNLIKGSIYKARSHAANFAPLPKYSRYFYPWDKQEGDGGDYSDIMELINKLMFYSDEQFVNFIESDIDVNNILNYFAVEFIIAGFDSYTKNYNLYIDKNGESARLFPWDNDATFGNFWDGNFKNEYIYNIDGNKDQNWACLRFNVLFQKLMEYESYRELYNKMVQNIITEGFDYLHAVIDSTYDLISHDVHGDSNKKQTNLQFDDEKDRLKYFIDERKLFLSGKDLFVRPKIEDIYISDPFPKTNQPIVIRVKLNQPADISFDFITDYNLTEGGREYTIESLQLLDDGMSQDVYAGDLIYGAIVTFRSNFDGITPITFRIGKTYYPANGFSYLEYGPTVSYALSPVNSNADVINNLYIKEISSYNETQLIEIENGGNHEIDLTYFHIRGNNGYDDFVIPPGVTLSPDKSLILSNNLEFANYVFPGKICLEYLSFQSNVNDTLKIFSPANTFLNSYVVKEIKELSFSTIDLVINEINYHSDDSLNSGDWIELYNPNSFAVRLGGWSLKDSNDDNIYTFPASAIIGSENFFVVAQNIDQFNTIHPDVSAMGSFEFGLSNSGESIRLFNEDNIQIIDFTYSDAPPWPTEPDGSGYSLELINPTLNVLLSENWAASTKLGGTPRQQNSTYVISDLESFNILPEETKLFQNYPNPFNPNTVISYSLNSGHSAANNHVKLTVFNLLGQKVATLVNAHQKSGTYKVNFDASGLPSGIYFYELNTELKVFVNKMILIK